MPLAVQEQREAELMRSPADQADMQEESIYNLVPVHKAPPARQPLYHSKHKGNIDPMQYEMGIKKVCASATFGKPLGLNHSSPDCFLKGHAREPVLPAPSKPSHSRIVRKDPVPKRQDVPQLGLHSNKNFVTANAVENILAHPPQRPAEFQWTMKPGFGEVPQYLQRNKTQVQQEKQQVDEYRQLRQQQESKGQVTQISDGERQDLLHHLKDKWAVANKAYQKLPFSLDTPAKQKRKERFEQQLTEIEKDIRLLEHGDAILVLQD